MHTKNYLNTEKLWFVTWRGSKGQEISGHSSQEMAERAKKTMVEVWSRDPDEIHIYEADKMP